MRAFHFIGLAVCLSAVVVRAEDTNLLRQIETLQMQMRQMREEFERTQREQQQKIESLTRRLDETAASLKRGTGNAAQGSTNGAAVIKAVLTHADEVQEGGIGGTNGNSGGKSAEQKELESQLAKELGQGATNTPGSGAAPQPKGWSPANPITIARAGNAYMNISFDAVIAAGYSTDPDPSQRLELGDHDPIKRGFSMRNAEVSLNGAVDPYFNGFANLVFKLDKNNETSTELEETYFQTTSLPGNLQVKGGQFFANFGRQNPQHPHSWAFVDQALILTRTFGPDGLRSLGVQASWLAPTPFYTEFSLGVLDGQGGTSFSFRNPGEPDVLGIDRIHGRRTIDRTLSGFQDLVYVPRVASSFDVTANQTIVAGLSGAFGPNETSGHSRSEIYGTDLYWKWKPANSAGAFPFVSWQTEALYQRYGAAADPASELPAENLRDYGFYSQVLWGFRPRWVAGLRGEYVNGNTGAADPTDVFRGERERISPVVTWYPSEFSRIRLQYNFDHSPRFGDDHSVWMQFEFLLGAHGAHKY